MLKAYIAAPWQLKTYAKHLALKLSDSNINAECQWFKHKEGDDPNECISHDLDDIENADIFILINSKEWANIGTGGRHFETGYAYLVGKKIYLLGEKTNLFHHDNSITVCNDYDELITQIKNGPCWGIK